MTKKLIALLMCLCLMLGLASCQKAAEPAAVVTEAPVATEAPAVEEVAAVETTATEETTTEETAVEETAAEETTVVSTPADNTGLNDTDVLLTVNGEAVTWADAKPYYDSFVSQYSAYYDMSLEENVKTFQAVATENAFHEKLLMQKATELGLAPLSEEDLATAATEADAIWEENVAYYMSMLTSEDGTAAASREQAVAYLEEQGFTKDYVYDNYSKSMVLDRLYEHVSQDVTITDADVEAEYQALVAQDKALYENDIDAYVAYNSNVDMNNMYAMYYGGETMDYAWYRPEGFRGIKHILLSVDESLMQEYLNIQAQLEEGAAEGEEAPEVTYTQADLDNAKAAILAANQEKIDEINQRLANGEDFEALIPEYTLDSDSLYEVCLGSTNYVPEFVEAAFSVDNVGDVSAPYISQFGIHIVKYMSDIPAGPIEMTEEQRAAKYDSLLTLRKDEVYTAVVEEWKAASTIEYTGLVMSYDELLEQMMAEEAAAEEAAAVEETVEETVTVEPAAEVTEEAAEVVTEEATEEAAAE